MNPDRIDLVDSARLTCRGAQLAVLPIDSTTLGLALVVDTGEFGQLAISLTIAQVAQLGQECLRAAQATPQELAAVLRLVTDTTEEGNTHE